MRRSLSTATVFLHGHFFSIGDKLARSDNHSVSLFETFLYLDESSANGSKFNRCEFGLVFFHQTQKSFLSTVHDGVLGNLEARVGADIKIGSAH